MKTGTKLMIGYLVGILLTVSIVIFITTRPSSVYNAFRFQLDEKFNSHQNDSLKRLDSIAGIELRIQWYDDSVQAICKVRGHIFKPIQNEYNNPYVKHHDPNDYTGSHTGYIIGSYPGLNNYYPRAADTTKVKLIEAADSSYLIYQYSSNYKHCYRCNQSIEFKRSPVYMKTVWRKVPKMPIFTTHKILPDSIKPVDSIIIAGHVVKFYRNEKQ